MVYNVNNDDNITGLTPVDVVQNVGGPWNLGISVGNLGLKIFLIRHMKKILNNLWGNVYWFYLFLQFLC